MVESTAYGSRMGTLLGLDAAPCFVVDRPYNIRLAATRLRRDVGFAEPTSPLPRDSAYLVTVHLRESFSPLWYFGRPQQVNPRRAVGGVTILDLEREPSVRYDTAFDMIQFNMPRSALDKVALENGAARINKLSWEFGKVDPFAHHLAHCILPIFERSELGCMLYAEHLMMGLQAYVVQAYGGVRFDPPSTRGRLAPWQLRLTKEILDAHLDGEINLSKLAQACNLSRSHFARAFKHSTGTTPMHWLIARRIDKAKTLLLKSDLPLADIAAVCGFADQSHFTRVFARLVGASPGHWRRFNKT